MQRYVAYYRVSTARQGKSGLGLAAQRELIATFTRDHGDVIGEFVEVQSGRKDDREELWKAIRLAKRENAKLLIARLDRFSRKVSFISNLMDQGIGLTIAEMPHATDFQLHIFAALAQEERRLISQRTRAALKQAKLKGTVLGAHGKTLAAANRKRAQEFAEEIKRAVPHWQAMSYGAIAEDLNRRGFLTIGRCFFTHQTVRNYLGRYSHGSDEERQSP